MTTRLDLRTRVRVELNDAGGVPLWSDGALNQWLEEAIRDYGEELPKEVSLDVSSVADQASYALPGDFDRAVLVEHPVGVFRVATRPAGKDIAAMGSVPSLCLTGAGSRTFDVWAGLLVLDPAPEASGEAIRLRYLATYAAPTSDGATLSTPARDDALLVWLVAGRALRWLGTDESKRQRFERQRGVSAQDAASQYERDVRAAYAQRRRRIQSRRLAVRG